MTLMHFAAVLLGFLSLLPIVLCGCGGGTADPDEEAARSSDNQSRPRQTDGEAIASDAEGMAREELPRPETDPQVPQRVRDWQSGRLGVFIHWAPICQLALGDGSWVIPKLGWEKYEAQAETFNPSEFDGERLAEQIKNMGAKYVVLTVKHHDGFCLWDTKLTDYKITNTPYGEDILRQYAEGLRDSGLGTGIYFSAWDWRRFDYAGVPKEMPGLMGRRGGKSVEEGNEHWPKFLDFYLGQVEELVGNYGELDVLWIDAWIKHDPEKWASGRFYEIVRDKQPNVVLNDRWADLKRADFSTAENYVPAADLGRPWETCMRSNGGWFYTTTPYKPASYLVRLLIECVSKNGNLMLNFPLNAKGTFDDEAIVRMQEIGAWMTENGESIYNCGAAPLRSSPWGWATARPGHIYLHLLKDDCDPNQPIVLEGLASPVEKATLLADGREAEILNRDGLQYVKLPEDTELDEIATVVDLLVPQDIKTQPTRFITDWTVLSPLPRPTGEAADTPIGPEARIDVDQPVEFAGQTHGWKTVRADEEGFVNLLELSPSPEGADPDEVTFAAVDVIVDEGTHSELLFGSPNAAQVFLNGREVLNVKAAGKPGVAQPDEHRARVFLPAGRNTLVIKSSSGGRQWGFFAWLAGGSEMRFEPTRRMAFLGNEPETWSNAAAVVEAEEARLLEGSEVFEGEAVSNGRGVRIRPAEPAEDGGFVAEVDLPTELDQPWVLLRYGHIEDTQVAVVVDGGEPVRLDLPATGGWRTYKLARTRLPSLKEGEHRIHVYTTEPGGAYHIDALLIAEGEPVGESLRMSGAR